MAPAKKPLEEFMPWMGPLDVPPPGRSRCCQEKPEGGRGFSLSLFQPLIRNAPPGLEVILQPSHFRYLLKGENAWGGREYWRVLLPSGGFLPQVCQCDFKVTLCNPRKLPCGRHENRCRWSVAQMGTQMYALAPSPGCSQLKAAPW